MIFFYNGKYYELHEDYTGEETVCAFYNLNHRFKIEKGMMCKQDSVLFPRTQWANVPDISVSIKIHKEGTLVTNLY